MRRKSVTIYDIAEKAGLSAPTVSRAINNKGYISAETQRRVSAAMEELGYRPRTGATEVVQKPKTLIVNIPILHNPFYYGILDGVRASARAHGYYVLVYQDYLTLDSIGGMLEMLSSVNADGLISTNFIPTELEGRLKEAIPTVQCSEFNTDCQFSYVGVDDVAAGRSVTEHLISMGGTRLAMINGPERFKYSRDRRAGFLSAMENAGLNVPNDFVVELPEIEFNLAYAVAEQLLSLPERPNAIFGASDVIAIAVLRVAKKYGLKVPDDLLIAGFDNTEPSLMCSPTLTTMDMPKYQIGFTACEMLIKQIENTEARPRSILLNTELIVRESTMAMANF